ncbi:MAG: hypothetical protein J7604_00760 [Sporocytophaga sp.]|uniref:hypothetical protein n=1 Tax=Sporocytophaga sp. TaxID=2231183 RepID=UPI001B032CE3|nr:hypothetical protein [Sporocytophaga sp.]MBO9698701.1 hypothetical protein [Sporocytophaga sp.]
MKKISKFFSMLAFAAVALLSSCSDDDDPKPAPSLEFIAGPGLTTGDVTLAPGSTLNVKWVANKGDKDMETFTVTREGLILPDYAPDGANSNPFTLKGSNQNTYQDQLTTTVPTNPGVYAYVFTVTDKNGNSTSKTIKVTAGTVQTGEISTFTATILGNENHATIGSFYDAEANLVYTQANAKTNASLIDFVFYHGQTNGASMAAPSNSDAAAVFTGLTTWSVRNATKFKSTSLTQADFNAVTGANVLADNASGATDTQVTNLAVGKVFAFTTVGGKSGLAYVKALSGSATASGTITIDVKIQK